MEYPFGFYIIYAWKSLLSLWLQLAGSTLERYVNLWLHAQSQSKNTTFRLSHVLAFLLSSCATEGRWSST